MRVTICLTLLAIVSLSAQAQSATDYINKGISFLDSNKVDSALEQLQKAIEIDKFNGVAFYNIGVCYIPVNGPD